MKGEGHIYSIITPQWADRRLRSCGVTVDANHRRLRRWQPYLEGQAVPVSPNWGRLCVLSFRGLWDGLGRPRSPSGPCVSAGSIGDHLGPAPRLRVCRRRSHPRFEPAGFDSLPRGSTHMMVHQTEIAPLEVCGCPLMGTDDTICSPREGVFPRPSAHSIPLRALFRRGSRQHPLRTASEGTTTTSTVVAPRLRSWGQ